MVSLTRTDPIWFRGTLPERYVAQLTTGLQIAVRTESLSQPVTATITRISPSLDLASRSLAFEARIEQVGQRSLFDRAAACAGVAQPPPSGTTWPLLNVAQAGVRSTLPNPSRRRTPVAPRSSPSAWVTSRSMKAVSSQAS